MPATANDLTLYSLDATAELLNELQQLDRHLADLYREYYRVVADEKQAKLEGWLRSTNHTDGGRRVEADTHAFETTKDSLLIKGDIEATLARRHYLDWALSVQVGSGHRAHGMVPDVRVE